MNLLGIDYGEKRIGLAIGSTDSNLASPLITLANDGEFKANLGDIIEQEKIAKLVVGLPRGLDGQDTRQTEIVRDFMESLDEFKLPVESADEALTSEEAASRLPKKADKAEIDQMAAAIFLGDYLRENQPK